MQDAWTQLPPRDPTENLPPPISIKEEVLDPLKLDLGEEELEMKAEVLAVEREVSFVVLSSTKSRKD